MVFVCLFFYLNVYIYSLRIFGHSEIASFHDEHHASITVVRQRRLYGYIWRHQDQYPKGL